MKGNAKEGERKESDTALVTDENTSRILNGVEITFDIQTWKAREEEEEEEEEDEPGDDEGEG